MQKNFVGRKRDEHPAGTVAPTPLASKKRRGKGVLDAHTCGTARIGGRKPRPRRRRKTEKKDGFREPTHTRVPFPYTRKTGSFAAIRASPDIAVLSDEHRRWTSDRMNRDLSGPVSPDTAALPDEYDSTRAKNRFCVKASPFDASGLFFRKPYRRICRSGPEPHRPAGGTTSETGPTSPPVAQRYGHLAMAEQKEKSPRTPRSKTSATNMSKDMRKASFVSDRNRANFGFRRSKPPARMP